MTRCPYGIILFTQENNWAFYFLTVTNNMFNTILPPNSPTCRTNDDAWALMTASSYHTGGVNVARLDGSVTFVSDTVNTGDLSRHLGATSADENGHNGGCYNNYTGPSTFGIWGAFGSASGGESTNVD